MLGETRCVVGLATSRLPLRGRTASRVYLSVSAACAPSLAAWASPGISLSVGRSGASRSASSRHSMSSHFCRSSSDRTCSSADAGAGLADLGEQRVQPGRAVGVDPRRFIVGRWLFHSGMTVSPRTRIVPDPSGSIAARRGRGGRGATDIKLRERLHRGPLSLSRSEREPGRARLALPVAHGAAMFRVVSGRTLLLPSQSRRGSVARCEERPCTARSWPCHEM